MFLQFTYIRIQARLSIVVPVIKTTTADFITRKVETLGSILSHETEGLLASHTTITESLYSKRTPINTRPQVRLSIVVPVIKAAPQILSQEKLRPRLNF